MLGMQPKVSRMDIYNDFNCDLVNLFLCARECTIQLVQELKFLPLHSRAEFDLLKEFMKHKELFAAAHCRRAKCRDGVLFW